MSTEEPGLTERLEEARVQRTHPVFFEMDAKRLLREKPSSEEDKDVLLEKLRLALQDGLVEIEQARAAADQAMHRLKKSELDLTEAQERGASVSSKGITITNSYATTPVVDQPPPVRNEHEPTWQRAVHLYTAWVARGPFPMMSTARALSEMNERDKIGRERYGTPLQPFNGRDALVDLTQELLDAVAYGTQAEQEGQKEFAETFLEALFPIVTKLCGELNARDRHEK
jgi:hypothetical protein